MRIGTSSGVRSVRSVGVYRGKISPLFTSVALCYHRKESVKGFS